MGFVELKFISKCLAHSFSGLLAFDHDKFPGLAVTLGGRKAAQGSHFHARKGTLLDQERRGVPAAQERQLGFRPGNSLGRQGRPRGGEELQDIPRRQLEPTGDRDDAPRQLREDRPQDQW